MIQSVKSQIQRRPALTHSIVGFVLFGASDAFAQQIEASPSSSPSLATTPAALLYDGQNTHHHRFRNGKKTANKEEPQSPSSSSPSTLSQVTFSMNNFDMARFLSAGVIGAFFGGCVYPFAYRRLDMLWRGNDLISIAKKSIVEVFTVGIFANSVSMGARGVLVGKNPSEVLLHVRDEMPVVTLNDLRVWFPYNLVAFGAIPIAIRPATTSLMEALWQTYISLRSNDYEHSHHRAHKNEHELECKTVLKN